VISADAESAASAVIGPMAVTCCTVVDDVIACSLPALVRHVIVAL
jgi:hypothetical protein